MNLRCLCLASLLLSPLSSRADDDHEGKEGRRPIKVTAASKQYAEECGSCHLAYPPSMLPARSWVALLGGLENHFSQNSELDLATRKQLEVFLTANAGRDVAGPTPLRITTSSWWRREHHEVSPAVYKRSTVLTAANCLACHSGAASGDFDEHSVRIPAEALPPKNKGLQPK